MIVSLFAAGMTVLAFGSILQLRIRDEVRGKLCPGERIGTPGWNLNHMYLMRLHKERLPDSKRRKQFYIAWSLGMLLIGSACAISALW